MILEGHTHEEWHKENNISALDCADCAKHGRIITSEEWLVLEDKQ